jgi:SlyX protein
MNADDRLTALEERLTFQQRLIDDLNAVTLDHRRELDRVMRELHMCQSALERIHQTGPGDNLPHEKPPHY